MVFILKWTPGACKLHIGPWSGGWYGVQGCTPSMLDDMDVPPFWPPFFDILAIGLILGYFSHPPTPKQSSGISKLPILTEFDLFGLKFHFPSIFWGPIFSGTPSSLFRPSTPPLPTGVGMHRYLSGKYHEVCWFSSYIISHLKYSDHIILTNQSIITRGPLVGLSIDLT